MKKYFLIVSFLFLGFWLQAIDYSGIYNYNKGVNKANGTICLFQINMDSAFFYLNNMSGAPDFNLTTIKGFLRIDTNACFYKKDSCKIQFVYANNILTVSQNNACKYDFSVDGKYKKMNNTLKKPNTWMTEYTEKSGIILADSSLVYMAPHQASKQISMLKKETNVKVIDEMNGFYLIEIPKQKNEFLWTAKKNVLLNKK